MIFRVTKSIWQVLKVYGLLGDGVTGFVTNQDEVNSGLASQSSSVGGPKRSVPCVDSGEPMLGKEIAKPSRVRVAWTRPPTLLVLKVVETNTVWDTRKAGIQVSPHDDHIPLWKTGKELITCLKEFSPMLSAFGTILDPGMLVGIEKVKSRGGKIKSNVKKPPRNDLPP